MTEPPSHGVSLREATSVWARIAALSFGGPAGQIAVMHRIVVEERRWVDEGRFLHALNVCMLLPGPEAQQLATYLGWLMHRTLGGVIAGVLFVLPGAVSVMALSIIYALYGQVPAIGALFFGLKAAVLAIVLQAVLRVGRRALRSRAQWALAAASFLGIFLFGIPFPLIVLGAGLIGFVVARAGSTAFAGTASPAEATSLLGDSLPAHTRDRRAAFRIAAICLALWLVPVGAILLTLGSGDVFARIATFFSTMAVVTFGGAYAALAYVAQQAVESFHWLSAREMLDGLGLAETTPGPLIMVMQFVAFIGAYRNPGDLAPLVAGIFGGLLATWVTFVPCFLFVFLAAPFAEALRGNPRVVGALNAVTAAVVGVILNLAVWFSLHTIFREVQSVRAPGLAFDVPVLSSLDPAALVLSLAAIVATLRFGAGLATVLGGCAAAGLLLHLAGYATG
ncbi:chromate efflux transporter [Methylobacterium sp. J-067]|uniref:chromate efflux transporter n=1 Tax=Methylobacterium sp. J-067 TaxID=2836648 RepID=UPI001FBAB048|nr:chromate efflux transporter [Methylobacterium sp. J-067]MCJ2025384.1 chromate efflux transporter [Methylobacterium sp. J-067]